MRPDIMVVGPNTDDLCDKESRVMQPLERKALLDFCLVSGLPESQDVGGRPSPGREALAIFPRMHT